MAQEDKLTYETTSLGTDGREACRKFWIAAYTRPRSEKKAASELSNIGIETFVPLQKMVKEWSDRKKMVDVVVLPLVIFAYVDKEEVLQVKRHRLVNKIITYPGQNEAAPIPEQQIRNLRVMLDEADEPVSFVHVDFKAHDSVKVNKGALKGLEGVVAYDADGKAYIIISINFLGGARVSIKPSELVLLNKGKR